MCSADLVGKQSRFKKCHSFVKQDRNRKERRGKREKGKIVIFRKRSKINLKKNLFIVSNLFFKKILIPLTIQIIIVFISKSFQKKYGKEE
jgi:hypothetical protein